MGNKSAADDYYSVHYLNKNGESGKWLTVGGFYGHFASKEQLVDATLREMGESLRKRLFDRIEEKPAQARASVILKRYLSAKHRDAQALGCPLPAVVGEIGTTAPAHSAVLAEQIDALARALEAQLPRTRVASPRALALGLVALMYGGLTLARALKGSALSDDILSACRGLGGALLQRGQVTGGTDS